MIVSIDCLLNVEGKVWGDLRFWMLVVTIVKSERLRATQAYEPFFVYSVQLHAWSIDLPR